MSEAVTVEVDDTIAVIRLDDGKANALSPSMINAIGQALDQAADKDLGVLLIGREGCFSAGFDLKVMSGGDPAKAREMIEGGGRLALRLGRFAAPVVIACSGHALAMGAVLLLAADLRIGSEGTTKIGFNEVAIGMTTPLFLIEHARERLSKRHFLRATVHANLYQPATAVDAGFLDQVVSGDVLENTAREQTKQLTALPRPAFLGTRKRARGHVLDEIEAGISADVAALVGAG